MSTIVVNDFVSFFKTHKNIKLIAFNGQSAEKLFRQKALPHLLPVTALIPRAILPSTSPAHASMRFEEKLAKWHAALVTFIEN
jgi:hypoxanthine-DNA glycosylase